MQDYELMLEAYAKAGGTPEALKQTGVAHLVVHANKVIGSQDVRGLILESREKNSGVEVRMVVRRGAKIARPVHLCFGVLPAEGLQDIGLLVEVEDGGQVELLAHCVFPNAVKVIHRMNARIVLGDHASYEYSETHFHGEGGGVEVTPTASMLIGRNSRLATGFSLIQGRVGRLDVDYEAEVGQDSTLEMTSKVYGYATDGIKIREVGRLAGASSRGLLKSRIAVKDNARSEVTNELTADAANARGHVDCVEVIQGRAQATAVPIVKVNNETARVTHEAAIGRVDKKQVETLMARGLEEEKAIDVVIGGMLR